MQKSKKIGLELNKKIISNLKQNPLMVEVQLFIIVAQLLLVRDADLIHKTQLGVLATHKVVVITISNPKTYILWKAATFGGFFVS